MGKCCVEGCTSGEGIEYFQFPTSKALRASWLEACGAPGAVCAAHFVDDDYTRTRGGRRLRSDAVPQAKITPSKAVIEDTTQETDKLTETNKKNETEKSEEKVPETIDKIEDVVDKEKAENSVDKKSDPKDGDIQKAVCVKGNGYKQTENPEIEEKDIEEMITNYQIKQTKTLADRLNPEPLEDLIPSIMSDPKRIDQLTNSLANNVPNDVPNMTDTVANNVSNNLPSLGDGGEWNRQMANQLAGQLASKLDSQLDGMLSGSAPVFIEVPVEKDVANSAASPEDCLMLLESVQCEVDPSSLMLPEHGPDTDSDMEIVCFDKKEDPISLLTSSDEDEVIIEEPHIDTVEVSDETDEDDKPLTTLIKSKEKVKAEKRKTEYIWAPYELYCEQCDYRTESEIEFKKHMTELHSTAIQICPVCSYTTASKAQFSRHKRKHRDERNYKCHLCNYKARHNMSLIYHLKSHNPTSERHPKFSCDKCGFSSHSKADGLKHIKVCVENMLYCDDCSYSTKRKSDLRRHRMRKHLIDDDDDDFRM